MKNYTYVVSTNLTDRTVLADFIEIVENGELLFFVLDKETKMRVLVAAAAPRHWLTVDEGE